MKSNEIQKSPPSNWSRINKQACNSSFRYHYIRKSPILDLVTPIAIIISLKGECLMKQIASFTIDHLKLLPGVYVSRKDTVGNEIITTFDIRVTRPNFEPVMNTAEIHTIEHLAATYLRNDKDFGNKIIYFGPMGCRTGFYLLLAGDYESKDIVPLLTNMFEFVRDFEGEVPGAAAFNCGNYLDMNLPMAKYIANRYLNEVLSSIDDTRLIYPN